MAVGFDMYRGGHFSGVTDEMRAVLKAGGLTPSQISGEAVQKCINALMFDETKAMIEEEKARYKAAYDGYRNEILKLRDREKDLTKRIEDKEIMLKAAKDAADAYRSTDEQIINIVSLYAQMVGAAVSSGISKDKAVESAQEVVTEYIRKKVIA